MRPLRHTETTSTPPTLGLLQSVHLHESFPPSKRSFCAPFWNKTVLGRCEFEGAVNSCIATHPRLRNLMESRMFYFAQHFTHPTPWDRQLSTPKNCLRKPVSYHLSPSHSLYHSVGVPRWLCRPKNEQITKWRAFVEEFVW